VKKAKLKKKKQELGAPDPGGDVVAASDVALEAPPVAAGDIAPDFVLRGAHGGERRLADLIAAGPALLVFFKTTCKASKIALPLYGELDRRYGDVVPVLAIAQDPVEVAQPWLADQRFAGPVLADLPTYEVSASLRAAGVADGGADQPRQDGHGGARGMEPRCDERAGSADRAADGA
jgi:peroxiredoxin